MADIPIADTNITPASILSDNSRYLKQKVIIYGDQRFLTFDTYKRQDFTPLVTDRSMIITKGVEYRPDLVAFQVYGTPNIWWKILEVNKLSDVFNFVAGRTIRLPLDIFE